MRHPDEIGAANVVRIERTAQGVDLGDDRVAVWQRTVVEPVLHDETLQVDHMARSCEGRRNLAPAVRAEQTAAEQYHRHAATGQASGQERTAFAL
jgi:hypothetical protein